MSGSSEKLVKDKEVWMTREKISRQLRRNGISVSPKTVGRLLKKLNFKLRVNKKQIARSKSPDEEHSIREDNEDETNFRKGGKPDCKRGYHD